MVTGPDNRPTRNFVQIAVEERTFLALVAGSMLLVGLVYDRPSIAMWVGFLFAGYSAVANDSIQTLGTFIAANETKPWWLLWIFVGGIFLATVGYSWLTYDGDVSYQRLASKGFETAPASFTYLQVGAPIVLLVLTRMRIPVSTTFLLLSCFATTASSVGSVLLKSVSGYVIAFSASIALWLALTPTFKRVFVGGASKPWHVAQWLSTGALWSVWLMQDAANIAVYLPRSLSIVEFGGFAGVIFVGLGVLFFLRGDRIQKVVSEKAQVSDMRSATVINLVYALVLYTFKVQSKIPMSTTWVFVGLLAGREIAMSLRNGSDRSWRTALRLAAVDLGLVSIGLLVSMILAFSVNDPFREQILAGLGM